MIVELVNLAHLLGREILLDELSCQHNGQHKQIKANDMMMTDGAGVVCTIIYGQDRRTPVTPKTKQVIYVTYAPVGVGEMAVDKHHEVLLRNVRLFAPDVDVLYERVETARG